jgi:CRISPR-associated protein Csb2
MLAVEVELLTDRYAATMFNDRNRAEWPPHPARLFSAAVAAWADADEPDDTERAALQWWEEQGEPTITCSWGDGRCSERAAVTHYVPVNDTQVVARDLTRTYETLRAALVAMDGARQDGDQRTMTKAERSLDKARAKAADDSTKAASNGQAPASAVGILPDVRLRQARVYPTAIPDDPRIVYRWKDADGGSPHVVALDRVLTRVARLGHSSSFVTVAVVDRDGDDDTLVPDESGELAMRVASPGQLDALEAAFEAHGGIEPRVLPALIAAYRPASSPRFAPPSPVFGQDWLVLDLRDGGRLTVRDTLALTRAIRGALLDHADQDPVPEILSGHVPGTSAPTAPTTRTHLAIVPLPFARHPHADGRVQAVALVLPATTDENERAQVERAVDRWMRDGGEIRLGPRGSVNATTMDIVETPASARPERWCAPSSRWSTVTPIALDRNPGDLRHRDAARREAAEQAAEAIVATSCTSIGLPSPINVAIHTDPLVRGSAAVRSFPRYAVRGGALQRVLVHAAIEFAEPVEGPMLLGAGRYMGYGCCIPIDAPRRQAARHD